MYHVLEFPAHRRRGLNSYHFSDQRGKRDNVPSHASSDIQHREIRPQKRANESEEGIRTRFADEMAKSSGSIATPRIWSAVQGIQPPALLLAGPDQGPPPRHVINLRRLAGRIAGERRDHEGPAERGESGASF